MVFNENASKCWNVKKTQKLFQLQYVQYVFIANVKAMLIMFSTVSQKYHNIASTDF